MSVGEGIDTRRGDRLSLEIRAVVAGEEKRRMLDRMATGLRARAAAREWPGGPAPYGFRLEPGPGGRNRLAVHESEAAVLREATHLIVDLGHSTWTAAQTLNALGSVPAATGRSAVRWEHPHLRRTLLSPTLGGRWTYNAEDRADRTDDPGGADAGAARRPAGPPRRDQHDGGGARPGLPAVRAAVRVV